MKELECKPKNTSSRCRLGGKINHLKMQWHSVSEMHMHLEVQGFPLLVLGVLTSIWKGAISFIYLFIFLHQKREILHSSWHDLLCWLCAICAAVSVLASRTPLPILKVVVSVYNLSR